MFKCYFHSARNMRSKQEQLKGFNPFQKLFAITIDIVDWYSCRSWRDSFSFCQACKKHHLERSFLYLIDTQMDVTLNRRSVTAVNLKAETPAVLQRLCAASGEQFPQNRTWGLCVIPGSHCYHAAPEKEKNIFFNLHSLYDRKLISSQL